MKYGLTLVTPPAAEPVDLATARSFCRLDVSDDDALVTALIVDARQRCERVSERSLLTQTWKLTLDCFPGGLPLGLYAARFWHGWQEGFEDRDWRGVPEGLIIRLPRPPLQAVTSIQYVDTTGALQTLDPSLYVVDASEEPGRVAPAYGKCWPATRHQIAAVTVTFTAGYGDTKQSVPADVQQRILNHVAYCYEMRTSRDETFLDGLFQSFFCGTY